MTSMLAKFHKNFHTHTVSLSGPEKIISSLVQCNQYISCYSISLLPAGCREMIRWQKEAAFFSCQLLLHEVKNVFLFTQTKLIILF